MLKFFGEPTTNLVFSALDFFGEEKVFGEKNIFGKCHTNSFLNDRYQFLKISIKNGRQFSKIYKYYPIHPKIFLLKATRN